MGFRGKGNIHERHREQLDAFVRDLLEPGEQVDVILLAFTGQLPVLHASDADVTWHSVVVTDRRVFCLIWNLALREPLRVDWSAPRSEVSVKWRPPLFPWWVYVVVTSSQRKLVLERPGHEPARLRVLTLKQLLDDAQKVASALVAPTAAFSAEPKV
jgi:hypothetical protein